MQTSRYGQWANPLIATTFVVVPVTITLGLHMGFTATTFCLSAICGAFYLFVHAFLLMFERPRIPYFGNVFRD